MELMTTPVKVVGAFTECATGVEESSALTRKAKGAPAEPATFNTDGKIL